ncbi:MAG TPA: hypothetical protein VMT00_16570 [Thermoanaerobaculia bacterium]|nr:hypothetical protein [Thermoanaerobaculia bacterium]
MKTASLLLLVTLVTSLPLGAQQLPIRHTPPECLPAEKFPLLIATVESKGVPRAYFRREGAEDWCWVDGTKLEDRAIFVFPKFESGASLEYYFATLDFDQGNGDPSVEEEKPLVTDRLLTQMDRGETAVITGRSPVLYRVRVTSNCRNEVARHVEIVTSNCGSGEMAAAIGAAYQLTTASPPLPPSPSAPQQ